MLQFIPIIGPLFETINGVTKAISNERIALINAKTEEQKIASAERIKTLEARRDVMVTEKTKANAYVRAGLALPVILIVWKLLVWDKAFGEWTGGHTDKLSDLDKQLIMAVVGFYLLYEGAQAVTRTIRGK